MKRIALFICAGAMFFTACNNDSKTESGKMDTTSSSNAMKEEAWVPVDSATMMQKMIEYGTPGPMHAMLASWNGTWTGETTMWPAEGAPAQKSTGTLVNTMIMDGKIQMGKHSGNMMGMPFEGMSLMGYDNASKKFTSTWVDNMSTGIMNMSGNWDEAAKSLTMSGTMPDMCRPGKDCSFREVFKVIDDNTQMMEMYGPDPATGKEYKMMEIKMTRKK